MPTKTAELTTLSADDLAAELARRAAEEQQRQQEQAERLDNARQAWDAATVDAYRGTDQRLLAEAEQARASFSAAVRGGDLTTALAAWTEERRIRFTRTSLRDITRQSALAIGASTAGLEADIRYVDPDFLARLEVEADDIAREAGYAAVGDLIGERPTEVA
ncbi:hypothetical protein [Nocardioides xinjiangensis]|uniref:hypothetical protein n=1 Tax=Nocardioides xinjiangensis TaxID=2817376 RepID=UPI001B318474|nr:hypothetical protein [Nocardioides sp. SYSU D00514]